MTTTHTPGPWKAERLDANHIAIRCADFGVVALAPTHSPVNAALLAAAPELLRVMKDLVSMYERGYVAGVSDRTGSAFLDSVLSARSIIAKAEGGA